MCVIVVIKIPNKNKKYDKLRVVYFIYKAKMIKGGEIMNKGTKIRTALRIAFSIYTAFCMWQVSIGELSQQLNAPWLVAVCAVIIVVSGIVVDFLTTYFNNDYTEASAIGTGITRQIKQEQKEFYNGDMFFTEIDGEHEGGEDNE